MNYIVTHSDGSTNRIVADEAFVTQHFPGAWVLAPDQPVTVAPVKTDSKIEFRALLSAQEQLIVDNFNVQEFASTIPAIQAMTVVQRAQIRSAIATFNDASFISLADPKTQQFVGALGALGLLDNAQRAAQILAGTPA
jgi:hypothetical protein